MTERAACPGREAAPSILPDRLRMHGEIGRLAERIAEHWLLGLDRTNPAMLGMFRERDRKPYRDLLPWSGEFAGKHATGAYYIYLLTRSQALYDDITGFLDRLAACQAEDGYLGCFSRDCRLTGAFSQAPEVTGKTWDAWSHYHVMTGLLLWLRLTGRETYRTALLRIAELFLRTFYGGRPRLASIGSTEMNLAPFHVFLQIYEMTGDRRYLDFAGEIQAEFAREDAGDYLEVSRRGLEFYQGPKPRWESLHTILGLAEKYAAAGDEACLAAARQITESILRTDVHNTGAFSTNEQAVGDPFADGAIETCCAVAFDALAARVAQITGDADLFDHLERSLYNAQMGAWHPSGAWSTYHTPMDGVRCANIQSINFQCRPGSPMLNCCSVNAPRGVGQAAEWMFTERDGGICVNCFEPMEAEFAGITLRVEGAYPAPGDVRITVSGAERPVLIRIPGWSRRTTVAADGAVSEPEAGTFFPVPLRGGCAEATVSFDFTPRLERGGGRCAGLSSVYCGPVLYGADATGNPDLETDRLPAVSEEDLLASRPAAGTDEAILWRAGALTLTDFAHLGQNGAAYRTWLRTE